MSSRALPIGHRIQEYQVLRVLGEGGFGITYLAHDGNLDQRVALKEYFPHGHARRTWDRRVVPTDGSDDLFHWGYRRHLDEARVLSKLDHRNVVRVRRYLKVHGTAVTVQDYVDGTSLSEVLDAERTLDIDQWRGWMHQLLDALAHVHDRNYLHRDVKPANIIVRESDQSPVLIDFGSARIATGKRTRTVVLSHGYAPIEQYSATAEEGPFTDLYALAAVTYRVLTGDHPASAPDRSMDERLEPLAAALEERHQEWAAAVDVALAVRPADRPRTASEWRENLESAWCPSSVLLRAVPPEEELSERGMTSLHWAVQHDPNPELIALLLDRGADIEATDRHGGTPLHHAAGKAHEKVARLLLTRGAKVDATNDRGATPLHVACRNDSENVAELLLERGADIEATCGFGVTPLHHAARKGHENVARLLLDRGADIEATCSLGGTPLHHAAWKGREKGAELLLDRGADIEATDSVGDTPLHDAAGGDTRVWLACCSPAGPRWTRRTTAAQLHFT